MYAPRDPITEYMNGLISLRQLRVMVEHLPAEAPWGRSKRKGWTDEKWLLYDISAHLRVLTTLTRNIHRGKGEAPQQPQFLPSPAGRGDDVADAPEESPQHEAEKADLLRTLNRNKH